MKPQIISFDGSGQHASDLAGTTARLTAEAAWRKQRIVILLPAGGSIPTKVAMAQWSLIFPPNQAIQRIAAIGLEVGEAYSQAITAILEHPELGSWEYLLTLEHDNLPPANGVVSLVRQLEQHPELSAVGGLYFTKGEGGVAQIWGDVRDPAINFRPQPPDPAGGLVECQGTGMGFTLFRLSMFRDDRLPRPWFSTKEGFTQDLYFWNNARAAGHRCAIDCSVRVGHYDLDGKFGPADFVW